MLSRLALAVAVLAASLHAHATNYLWFNPSGTQWVSPSQWSPNGIPGCDDQAQLYFGLSTITLSPPACINQIIVDSQGYTIQGAQLDFSRANSYIQTINTHPLVFTNTVSID